MNERGPAGTPNEAVGLSRLTDMQLESGLRELLGASARLEVRIALQLLEVEQRRLHLRTGYSSLYEYCRERMGLSEFEAYLRICAARVGRAFPLVFELLSARAIHLSTIHLLRDYLTTENHRALLAEASHRSKRQVAELLARRFPRADVATTLQKLPSLEPLSPGRYRLELTIGAELRRKLELASDLLSHANPSRDIGTVIERALDELISSLEKRRFAETKALKKSALRADSRAPGDARGPGDATAPGAANRPGHPSAPRDALAPPHDASRTQVDVASGRSRRHIANAVRRAVSARDERRCTFTSEDGRRCEARAFLELHHEQALARGGADSRENLRWLCAAHNRLLAERDFGGCSCATGDCATLEKGPPTRLKLVQTRRRRALAARTKARSNEVRRATLAVHAETRPAKVRTELPRDRDTAGHWRQLSGTLVSASARHFTISRPAMAVPHNVMTLLDINPAWQEAVVGNLILGAPGPSPRLGLSSGPRWTARPLWTA